MSFGYLSEILQMIWYLLWHVSVKDCRGCAYRQRETGLLLVAPFETARLSGLFCCMGKGLTSTRGETVLGTTLESRSVSLEKNIFFLIPIVMSST